MANIPMPQETAARNAKKKMAGMQISRHENSHSTTVGATNEGVFRFQLPRDLLRVTVAVPHSGQRSWRGGGFQ